MQNYHRHTCYSNIFTPDSAETNENYAKRAVELGHKIISSVEHGWQGYYFETYELAKKYNLKMVVGAEAYWVKNRLEEYSTGKINKDGTEQFVKDKSNHHIILLAKNNKGREALNDILSEASISGYYYRPRVDLELLLSLPADDIFVTTACIAFSGYDDIENIILQLHNHFKNNFMLEIQYHNTEKQKEWNKYLLAISKKYNIKLIVGLDSHYIHNNDSWQRDVILDAKNTHYEDEEGWYMDYPSDEEVMRRFLEQGVFNHDQIKEAMDNTDICLTFDNYDDVYIFNKDIKLPTLYPDCTKEEKDKIYSKLITKKFKEYMKNIPESEYNRYFEGIKSEIQTYKDTGMVDYPLLDYAIVQDGINHGGIITNTGRGSAVGFMTNTLCGFSKVDRFTSAVKIYPERFISTTRILETKSLPDIDLNLGNVEVFEESQKRILGENHAYPAIAFGTLKKKSSFKLYAKAKGLDFSLANEISEQITQYDEAVKNAEEDDKELIDIYDYVDIKYQDYIEQSKEYWGIVSDKKKAPSAYLLYQGDIRREIGLIKCKSESTGKECITCVVDGAILENYKFLKNDLLKVDSVLLIDKVFKRIGIENFDVNTLLEKTKNNKKVWDLYANGYTIGINQVEQDGSRKKCMNYKPHNISELSAFVAAIRPGFKSLYKKFEAREDFKWNIPSIDNLLATEEMPTPWILYQEQCMAILNYAGFPMSECYSAIKAIAKKHPEKVKPLKSKFIEGFIQKLLDEGDIKQKIAEKTADDVWEIINNFCGYSFNASHSCCMALDSLYQAWQKAEYPFEFYEVNLKHFSEKGKKDKVAKLKSEMRKAFGINEGDYIFGADNREFVADKNNYCINPALSSIKGLSKTDAEKLYQLGKNHYKTFFDVLVDIKKVGISSTKVSEKLETLIKIGYFKKFGEINTLLKQAELFFNIHSRKQLNISDLDKLEIPIYIAQKYCKKQTDKQFKDFEPIELLEAVAKQYLYPKTAITDCIRYQNECLGYINLVYPKLSEDYYYIKMLKDNWLTLYQLATGDTLKIKVRKNTLNSNPVEENQVIKVLEITQEKKWGKDENGNWIRKEEYEDILSKYSVLKS